MALAKNINIILKHLLNCCTIFIPGPYLPCPLVFLFIAIKMRWLKFSPFYKCFCIIKKIYFLQDQNNHEQNRNSNVLSCFNKEIRILYWFTNDDQLHKKSIMCIINEPSLSMSRYPFDLTYSQCMKVHSKMHM